VLAGLMTKAAGRYLSTSLNKKIQTIEDGGFDAKLHGTLAEAVCYLQMQEMIEFVTKWWDSSNSPLSTSTNHTPPPSKKAKRVRISVPEAVEVAKPRLGIQIISYILERYGTRKYMKSHLDQLRRLESELKKLWEHVLALAEESAFDARWSVEILKLRATMVALLCSKESRAVEASAFLASFMDLLRVNVWPIYNDSLAADNNVSQDKEERAKAILQTSFTIWSNFIMCGLCNDTVIGLATDLTKFVFNNDSDTTFYVETAQLTYHLLDYVKHHGIAPQVAQLLRPWFDQMVQFTSSNEDLFQGMDEVTRLVNRFAEVLNN